MNYDDKTKDYYIFYINPKYHDMIPMYGFNQEYPHVFGYTDKKSYAKEFARIHSKKAFILKKVKLNREEINSLASNFQNGIIRKEKMTGKNENYERVEVDLCITEKEITLTDNTCYAKLDSMYRYMWDVDLSILKKEFQKALIRLRFAYFTEKLNNGECELISGIEADRINAFISIFKPVLEVGGGVDI